MNNCQTDEHNFKMSKVQIKLSIPVEVGIQHETCRLTLCLKRWPELYPGVLCSGSGSHGQAGNGIPEIS